MIPYSSHSLGGVAQKRYRCQLANSLHGACESILTCDESPVKTQREQLDHEDELSRRIVIQLHQLCLRLLLHFRSRLTPDCNSTIVMLTDTRSPVIDGHRTKKFSRIVHRDLMHHGSLHGFLRRS